MPSGSGQKGTGKKNAAAMQKQSRTSTPVPAPTATLPTQEAYDPDYLNTRVILFKDSISFDDIVDQSAVNSTVPDSRSIDIMMQNLKDLIGVMEKRSNFYDRGMRFLADERKKRPDDYAQEGEQEGKRPKHKRKKGSDSLAPPDGSQGTSY
jgi:transcriptional adapter 3